MKCEICKKDFNGFKGLAMHLFQIHEITSENYYLEYINPIKGVCKICGNNTKFVSLRFGYQSHCNIKCVNIDCDVINKRRDTCEKNYGCSNPSQSELIKKKKEETCLKNNGCLHPSQSELIKKKKEETCLKNNGCKNPLQSEKIRKKGKVTSNIKYGCDYPMQNKQFCEEMAKKRRLTFKQVKEKYTDVVLIENLIEGPNGEFLAHCKNIECKNSIKNGGRFEINVSNIIQRNVGIKSTSDSGHFYCCDECKKTCILYGKSAATLNNIIKNYENDQISPQEYSTWRNEVFLRQLKDNSNHLENFCEICHSTEDLHAHHIQPQKLEPGYALDPINGMILCQDCHFKHGHEKGSECSTGNLANKICKKLA